MRISELKKGNVQFTDSTNASRLIHEHRRELAVKMAAWVKELNITSERLDADPWPLNVHNGTHTKQ